MTYAETLLTVISALNTAGVAYVLIGGGALNVHGLIRATEALDIFVAPTPDNVERLKTALKSVWDDDAIDEITAADLCGDYPAIRYGPPEGSIWLDILTRLGERTSWEELEWEELELRGLQVRVATPAALYRMKKNTVRPRDWADARALADAFDLEDDDAD